MLSRLARLSSIALAAVALAACNRSPTARPAPVATVAEPFEHRFTVAVGGVPVQLRLAIQPHEMQRGLMFVQSLPEDEGMLFVYDEPQRMSFWMRNTLIPLDIGFFDEAGVLHEVRALYPGVEDPTQSASDRLQFALEVNQGWFGRRGVKPGATLDVAALRAALRARGADPQRYLPAP